MSIEIDRKSVIIVSITEMMASGMPIPASAAMGINPEMETILRIHHDIQGKSMVGMRRSNQY